MHNTIVYIQNTSYSYHVLYWALFVSFGDFFAVVNFYYFW